jgi:hypothetical protein
VFGKGICNIFRNCSLIWQGMMTLSLRRLLPVGQKIGWLEMIQYLANSAYGILCYKPFSLDVKITRLS